MNQGRYFIPNMMINPMLRSGNYLGTSRIGLLNRLTQGIKSFNWGQLLNNTSKTLNVMNQAIPLVRQTKPMIGNFKSMLKLAKAFKNETSSKKTLHNNYFNTNDHTKKIHNEKQTDDNYPTFFI